MRRRRFLRRTGAALLVLPFGTFLVQACYGGTSDDEAPAAPPTVSGSNAVYTSSVDGGHSHTFAIALAAFETPTDTSGETSLDDGHVHFVAITAAELEDVKTGQTVEVTTGNADSHTHVLTLVKVA